jgi:hypothetical protein
MGGDRTRTANNEEGRERPTLKTHDGDEKDSSQSELLAAWKG